MSSINQNYQYQKKEIQIQTQISKNTAILNLEIFVRIHEAFILALKKKSLFIVKAKNNDQPNAHSYSPDHNL